MNSHFIGLLLACGCATTSVATDVLQKRALLNKPLYPTILSERVVVFALLTGVVLLRVMLGKGPSQSGHSLRVVFSTPHFIPVLAVDCLLLAASIVLYYRALQIAPLSLTIPFLTFTPAFLLLTSHLVLQELLTLRQIEGVAVVVYGSFLMYRSQFKVGWLEPLRALGREPGSRYMLTAALIMSLTNSLEKWLILRSDVFTFAWLYSAGSCVLMTAIVLFRALRQRENYQPLAWRAIAGAGFADATTLSLQFAALVYLPAVVTIGIKRSGILLTVLAGWFFFKERHIATRLVAAAVMVCGAMMLSFSFPLRVQTGLLVAMCLLGTAGPRVLQSLAASASLRMPADSRLDP